MIKVTFTFEGSSLAEVERFVMGSQALAHLADKVTFEEVRVMKDRSGRPAHPEEPIFDWEAKTWR